MKKRLVAVVLAGALIACLALFGCADGEEKSRQGVFLDAVEQGMNDWFDMVQDEGSDFETKGQSPIQLVQAQLDRVSDFSSSDFQDETFAQLVDDYKEALNMQVDGLGGYPRDASLYNSEYVEGRKLCIDAVSKFKDKYGLKASGDDGKVFDAFCKEPIPMLADGEFAVLKTADGEIELSIDGFSIDEKSTARARESDGFSDSQNYGFLLCTLKNDSVEPKEKQMNNWLNLSSGVSTKNADGVDLTSPNFSYSFPGYDVATGGYYQIPAVGASKKVAIPYVIDSDVKFVSVNMGGAFRIVSVQ